MMGAPEQMQQGAGHQGPPPMRVDPAAPREDTLRPRSRVVPPAPGGLGMPLCALDVVCSPAVIHVLPEGGMAYSSCGGSLGVGW